MYTFFPHNNGHIFIIGGDWNTDVRTIIITITAHTEKIILHATAHKIIHDINW